MYVICSRHRTENVQPHLILQSLATGIIIESHDARVAENSATQKVENWLQLLKIQQVKRSKI